MTTADRWPTVAEVAIMMAAWVPEAASIQVIADVEGVPFAVIDITGLSHPLCWSASDHGRCYSFADRDDPVFDRAAWVDAATRMLAGRDNAPDLVWRWRVEPAATA